MQKYGQVGFRFFFSVEIMESNLEFKILRVVFILKHISRHSLVRLIRLFLSPLSQELSDDIL